jgi:hypothetical protein
MALKFFALTVLIVIMKALLFFVAWNYVFVEMCTVLKPISIGIAFAATFCYAGLTFVLNYKETR